MRWGREGVQQLCERLLILMMVVVAQLLRRPAHNHNKKYQLNHPGLLSWTKVQLHCLLLFALIIAHRALLVVLVVGGHQSCIAGHSCPL